MAMEKTIATPTDGQDLLPHFYMSYHGKRYRIFKRQADRSAPYYVNVMRRGKTYRRCLEVNVQDLAEPKAKEIIDLIMNDRTEELEALKLRGAPKAEKTSVATIGEIISAYRQKAAVFIRPRTINDNINALRLIIREAFGKSDLQPDGVDRLKSDVLTGRLIARFEEGRLRPVVGDEERRQSILVSINAYARAARSIFKDKLRKMYTRDLTLVLPDVADFLEEELEQPARIVKEAVPGELIQKTFAESLKLRESDRPAYIAFLLSVCSLRRGEIQRAEWSWIDPVRSTIRIPRESKSKVVRFIPLPESVMKELNEFKAADLGARPEWDQTFVLPCPAAGQGAWEQKPALRPSSSASISG